MKKVFIDGNQGTTGLKIRQRLKTRRDIELLEIRPELRKDLSERKKMLNSCDIAFLCLPDSAAVEAVALIENQNVRIIDTSTAHRTAKGWIYGFAELSDDRRGAVANGLRVAVPGCHASGFVSVVYPLIAKGILPRDYPLACHSLTGYSGGGKKMIAEYEDGQRPAALDAPRLYGLTQQHKHLSEIKLVCGLADYPLFTPIVCDYFSGMAATVPIFTKMLNNINTLSQLRDFYAGYYKNQKLISVLAEDQCANLGGYLAGNSLSGYDNMEIIITGNDDRLTLTSRFDNLGKGASGAAIQCMNIMLGVDEAEGLIIKA